MRQFYIQLRVYLLMALLFTACQSSESLTPAPALPSRSEIPASDTLSPIQPAESLAPQAYPIPEQPGVSAYPAPVTSIDPGQLGPEFAIDTPLVVGGTLVAGTGPAGLPIRVIDITTLGETLGTSVIGDDGTFRTQLGSPLKIGHSIGLQIGALEGTTWNYNDFLRGPGYQDIPLVGTIFAQAIVRDQ